MSDQNVLQQTETTPENNTKTVVKEWVGAVLLAIIAATFIRIFFIEAYTIPTSSMEKSLLIGDYLLVSKLNYGARLPMTPISFPFAHHTLPFSNGKKAYKEWLKIPYYRLPGFGDIQRNDVIVFNYPVEDFRPVDKREHYIKRCVGLPNDTLEIIDRQLFINNKPTPNPQHLQYSYFVRTNKEPFQKGKIQSLGITEGGLRVDSGDLYEYVMTKNALDSVNNLPNVTKIDTIVRNKGQFIAHERIFPSDKVLFPWNIDNYGAIVIPKKGQTVVLTKQNIPLYQRIITIYEGNTLVFKDGNFFLNDEPTDTYTFKMDYYFMMGDNRHNSADSRYWGFVPADHIVGKAVWIWLSIQEGTTPFYKRIRWDRLFSSIQ